MLHETYAILAETLSEPTPCLPPGFSGPVSTALGWVKALSLVIGVAVFVLQAAFCRWWLRGHRQGPLESLWHRLTWLGAK